MIEFYKKTVNDKELIKIDKFSPGCWIYVKNPSSDELKSLSEDYELELELLEDSLDENELPRIDYDTNKNSYIYSKLVEASGLKIYTTLIVLGENFVMTIMPKEMKIFKAIFKSNIDIITTQRIRTLLQLLEILIENTQNSVQSIVKEVTRIKNTKKDFLEQKDMESLLRYEEFLNEIISNYSYTLHMYSKIPKRHKLIKEDRMFLEDLIIESEEGMQICKNSLKTITNIRNFYSTILSNRLNKNITFLTIATIMLNVPAVIGAIYGMNVSLPYAANPLMFYYLLILIAAIMGAFIFIFKRFGIFR